MKNYNPYLKFAFMMAVSFIVMYAVMFLNVYETDHIYLSLTRTYMTLLMVAPMAITMLFFMWKMYPNRNINLAVIGSSITIFILCLYGLRSQVPIGDVQWMKAMIPHHSSAILTSSNANIQDSEVNKLALDIIEAPKKEIAEMKILIKRIENDN